jgi:RNA polymerase sigma-70 factor (ECF subfamily)
MSLTRGLADASEAELVERFRATRAPRFFDELYQRSRRRVFAVCLRIVGDAARAEDLCHDTFVRAFQGFDRFSGTTFAAWVCRIGVNLSLNEVRHRTVAARSERQHDPPVTPAGAERRLVSREALDRAAAIIEGLEPHQRRVFLLRHLDELSYGEIAERTGWTGEQVRSFLQNARRNFRIAWERWSAGEPRGEEHRHG